MIRNINQIDDDIIRKKRLIGEMLYSDPDIVEVLDNESVDPTCPDELMYNSIFPFIRIPGAQDVSRSYITYMLDDIELSRQNTSMKKQYLKVVIFVHRDLIKTPWGAERHDILSFLVKDVFHLSNALGIQLTLISDKEGTTDTDFCTRSLQFEMTVPNRMQPYQTNKYERTSIVGRQDKKLQRDTVGGED